MGEEAILDEVQVNRSLEKEGLLKTMSDLEIDYAQGKLHPDDYHRLKLTQEHRLLNLLERSKSSSIPGEGFTKTEPLPTQGAVGPTRKWGLILAIGVWIVAGTVAVSSLVYGKINRTQTASVENNASTPGMPPINPAEMVARLEAKLRNNPNDLKGQMMLGRSYMVLQRWEDAKAAWQKVLELDERNPTAHVSLGEVLLRSNPPGDRQIAEEALTHFDQALISTPQDPSLLWARGIALVTLGRFAETDEAWTTAYQALSPGTEEAEMIKTALEALRSGKIQSP